MKAVAIWIMGIAILSRAWTARPLAVAAVVALARASLALVVAVAALVVALLADALASDALVVAVLAEAEALVALADADDWDVAA